MNSRTIALAIACLVLNVVLTKIAVTLALPVYLDTIGTILAAMLVPLPLVLGVGVGSALLSGVVSHPAFPFYAGTQIVIGLVAIAALRANWFRGPISAALVGLLIAVVAAVVSAPVTAYLFGGITATGTSAVTAIFLASGAGLWKSVITGALLTNAVDKIVAALLAWQLKLRLPSRFENRAL